MTASQSGAGHPDRPGIAAGDVLRWLAGLDPLDRAAAADDARSEALRLVGQFADVRRAALAEAHAQGLEVDLSAQSIRDAVRPERVLLQSALEILVRDGVSSTASSQLMQGLRPRAPLDVVARRVLHGVANLMPGRVSGQEHELLLAARRRAAQLLPGE